MSKPFLRWAGSKRQLVPKLLQFLQPSRDRYIEPFMGSACLYFAAQPKGAVLSDLNVELVNTFRVVRDRPRELAARLHRLPQGKRAYYRIRATQPANLSSLSRAARFLYLNRFCFNGLYRTNRAGQFNVPFGGDRVGQLAPESLLYDAAELLKSATLRAGDFETILYDSVEAGDFVYLDPPYSVKGRRVFREYGPSSFGRDDIQRLVKAVRMIDERGADFVLSYALSRALVKTLGQWNIYQVDTRRNIAGFTGSRRTVTELIVTNVDCKVDLAGFTGDGG